MNFESAKATYRDNALVQKLMASKLISFLIEKKGAEFGTVFETGSGTGFLTDEIIKKLKFKKIILNDLTENYTGHIPNIYIKGDINKIKIPKAVDLIISNAMFQWILDYKTLFSRLYCALKKNGTLCFSTFGEKNFFQIKEITGLGLNYPILDDFIKNAGFKIVYFEQELQTLYFKDVRDVLNHIKLTGVKTKNSFWTKSDFRIFKEKYLEKYKDSLGFELTYHPVFYVVEKVA